MIRYLTAGLLAAGLALPAFAQIPGTPDEKVFPKPPYSPYAGRNYPTRPYFGDTHLHTANSMDAGAFGARLSTRMMVRFFSGWDFEAKDAYDGEPRLCERRSNGRGSP